MNTNSPTPTFDAAAFDLPAAHIADDVNNALCEHNTLIITAPPGAGKSTLLPLTMLQTLAEGKILMLEPRRLAARQIAARMSEMIGQDVGQTVGYRIRFDNCVGAATRIEVLTEGILTRMLQTDNALEGVSIVVFDEFHERSLFADVALALCRECQQILRPDLKIVVMSATLDTDELSAKLSAPVLRSEGRMFPVEIRRADECSPECAAPVVAHAIREAHTAHDGDILAFLPGEADIRRCEELLAGISAQTDIYPLYGMLQQAKQNAAIRPSRNGRRKIVLATSIAETSLTIEGVRVVVDSGLCRQLRFDAGSGLSRLETVRISMDMADQRAGRAGRLSDGVCYRLWTAATEQRMKPHRTPEILQADLSQLVLDMAMWGEADPERLTWLVPPPRAAVEQARELLQNLDALDDDGRITDQGRRIYRIPCHPRMARMLLEAADDEQKALAADIAALLDDRDPLPRETGIDIGLRIDALRRNRRDKRGNRALDRIEKVASQYRRLLSVPPDNNPADSYLTGMLIAAAYPERIASAVPGNNAQFMLSGGNMAMAMHTDSLAHEPWLAVAHLDARDGHGKIFLAAPLDPQDLRSRVVQRDNVSWNSKRGMVVAQREQRIGKLVLHATPLANPDRAKVEAVLLAALRREGARLLGFTDEVERLQNRIMSVRAWHEADGWPDVSTEHLLSTVDEWFTPYLGTATTSAELKRIDLHGAILGMLTYDKQRELDRLAPSAIAVPSGSNIKIEYSANGSSPVLAVRLQEVFGLADTPTVDDGRRQVLMHLLSPGFKPVQVTQDLRSFWNDAYFDVKKELKSRYPKHVWPDDPWNEPPIRGAKRRK